MLKKLLLAVCASGFALTACAADNATTAAPTAEAPASGVVLGNGVDAAALKLVQQSLAKLVPGVEVDVVNRAPMPGFYQVIASGQLVYVSTDGRYLLNGDLVDLDSRKSLNSAAWSAYRKAELAKVPASARIEFAPPNPKYRVTVFTDVSCPYCKVLHEHIAEYNKEGIAVDYLAWPRDGVIDQRGQSTPVYKEMASVWCAADRKTAFTAAKDGHAPKPVSCANPVRYEYELGLKLGVNGTPAIFTPSGRQVGGFLTPAQLLQELQKEG